MSKKYDIGGYVEVLDHGYIKLVDVMGSDSDICTAARVSYHEASTKKVNEDKGLIDHLLRHRHTSPFEMGEMKFEVKLPIFVERQWVRHRTCSMNEMSGRYSEMPEEYHVPEIFRMQDTANKQGTVGVVGVDGSVGKFVAARQENARRTWQNYHDEMAVGVGREQAREMLPLAVYTKKVWKMDLHNLFHFLKLRTDSHAQWEIQCYANEIEKFVKHHFPWSYASVSILLLWGMVRLRSSRCFPTRAGAVSSRRR
jgi:thymidylate synthase (FAD)